MEYWVFGCPSMVTVAILPGTTVSGQEINWIPELAGGSVSCGTVIGCVVTSVSGSVVASVAGSVCIVGAGCVVSGTDSDGISVCEPQLSKVNASTKATNAQIKTKPFFLFKSFPPITLFIYRKYCIFYHISPISSTLSSLQMIALILRQSIYQTLKTKIPIAHLQNFQICALFLNIYDGFIRVLKFLSEGENTAPAYAILDK